MNDDEKFFDDIEALAKVYANEAENRMSKKVKIVKKCQCFFLMSLNP
jgi:hypothetical protein